jgi:hypothetical protein
VFTPARAAIRLRAVVSARELAAGGGDRRRGHSGIRVAARSAGWLSNALAPLVRSPFRRVAVSPRTDSGADDHGVLHGFEVALDTRVVARARTRLLVFDGRLSASLARFGHVLSDRRQPLVHNPCARRPGRLRGDRLAATHRTTFRALGPLRMCSSYTLSTSYRTSLQADRDE